MILNNGVDTLCIYLLYFSVYLKHHLDPSTFRLGLDIPTRSGRSGPPIGAPSQFRNGDPDMVGTFRRFLFRPLPPRDESRRCTYDPLPLVTPKRKTRHSNSFSCNTYGIPRKCCKQKTYGGPNSFRCNTYKKQGEGDVMVNQLPRKLRRS